MNARLTGARAVLIALGFIGSTGLSFAYDMRFQLVSVGNRKVCRDKCLQIIAADGDIVRSTPDAFVDFVKSQISNKRVRTIIMFNSPGGEVYPSLRLGLILRKG